MAPIIKSLEADKICIYTKCWFKCDDELWARVVSYKIEKHLKNNNDALKELVNLALDCYKTEKLSMVVSNR